MFDPPSFTKIDKNKKETNYGSQIFGTEKTRQKWFVCQVHFAKGKTGRICEGLGKHILNINYSYTVLNFVVYFVEISC